MDFILSLWFSHWHCIVPAIAIIVVIQSCVTELNKRIILAASLLLIGSVVFGRSAADINSVPAGVAIPADTIALAETQDAETYGFPYQTITVNLHDNGIEPAIVVLQRNMPALLNINNDSLDPENSRLVFPAYYTRLDIAQGENIIQLMPTGDSDFSTGDSVFFAYVKVVDDLNSVDADLIEAIKAEVSGFETQIYPDAYFEAAAASQGGGCCGVSAAGVFDEQLFPTDEVLIARKNRREVMEFLLSHWHCIAPAIAIVIVILLHKRDKKSRNDE